jgi:hypothetical protein
VRRPRRRLLLVKGRRVRHRTWLARYAASDRPPAAVLSKAQRPNLSCFLLDVNLEHAQIPFPSVACVCTFWWMKQKRVCCGVYTDSGN